ncbi:hypothetical protein [Erythrobacter sp. JK5]|uniref:hypothetical protein n=1 Tax=Erythrobacter sp. JK5 TaxID=2829500 RepID=UPI001BAB9099|nr:hypothetical protein [Erythrobacter sp. JK5]QUL36522.1 hypothetical protein KDC96_08690 [Erythrobacter sp. JK5]
MSHSLTPSRLSRLALAAALCAAAPGGASVAAQESPGSFRLPDPTPTPTPAPQGPVDVRSGVPIAPRVIPEDRPTRPVQPTPAPTPTPAPAPAPTSAPVGSTPTPAARTPAPRPSASPSPSAPAAREAGRAPAPAATSSPNSATAPPPPTVATDQSPAPAGDTRPAIASDGWYTPEDRGEAATMPSADGPDVADGASPFWEGFAASLSPTRIYALGGTVLLVLLALGFLVWRRRRLATARPELSAPTLAAGVRNSIAATQLREAPGVQQPKPAPMPEPPRLDLTLEIVSAARSLMMFTLEYRLTIANRSDHAARDIEVSGQLTSAQGAGANAPPVAGGQPFGSIDRIGPHQSRVLGGQLQLPLAQVQALRQGAKPLFIPLMHVRVLSAGGHSLTRSFVVGSPSSASQGRVHPIRLDTPPGGLPGLRAREVNLENA